MFSVKNIFAMVREYKLIFAMFFSVFAMVACSLLYIHVYNVGKMESGYDTDRGIRTYRIRGTVESGREQEFLDVIWAAVPGQELQSVQFRTFEPVEWDDTEVYIAMSLNVDQTQLFLDRGSLTWKGDGAEIIVSTRFYSIYGLQCGINDVVTLWGIPFTVRGIGDMGTGDTDMIVSPEGYYSLGVATDEVVATFGERLSARELQALESAVGSNHEIIVPDRYNTAFNRQFFNRFLLIGAMILMATMNIMGLYRYIIMRRKKEFLIYRIYGMSQRKLFGMILTETFILSTVGFLLGAVLFLLLAHAAEDWIFGDVRVEMFIQAYMIELLCAFIAALPIVRRLGKRGIYGEYGREEAR